jgi:hypothetical protein
LQVDRGTASFRENDGKLIGPAIQLLLFSERRVGRAQRATYRHRLVRRGIGGDWVELLVGQVR